MQKDKPVIYIADDDEAALTTYEAVLEGRGYELFFFKDGRSLFNFMQMTVPDLLILDMMMPGIDGFELCWRVRHEEAFKEIPIMLMTAATTDVYRQRGIALGANVFLNKPINRRVFLEQIDQLLGTN